MSNQETSEETTTPVADLKEYLDRVGILEEEKRGLNEDIAELKKEAFTALKEKKAGTAWTKKALAEAFRLLRMPTEERNIMFTQVSSILRDSGRGEIDLHTFT